MERVGVVVAILAVVILGVAVFLGVQEVRERAGREDGEGGGGAGWFGILREDFISKDPYQEPEPTRSVQEPFREFGSSPPPPWARGSSDGDFGASPSPAWTGGSSGAGGSGSTKEVKPPSGFEVKDLSPLFGQVVISAVYPSRSSDYERTAVYVSARSGNGEAVSVSGWEIRTDSGEVTIPRAIEDYAPGSSGEEDILLQPGHRLRLFGHYWSTYQHPFGKNIRLNRCVGYLNNVYEFDPELPNRCLQAEEAQVSSLSFACRDFALSLGRLGSCREPSEKDLERFSDDRQCSAFLRNSFGYGLCYQGHRDEPGFLLNEWYAWLEGRQIPLDPDDDRVLLFDLNGLLVDEHTY